jgi:MoxR-like ATPase
MEAVSDQIMSDTLAPLHRVMHYLDHRILGQQALTQRLLVALLADGHLLVEGAPGLAKTTAIKALADCIEGDFHRIQFTPDLLPADLTGTDIYRPQTGEFVFQQGPLFHHIVLADEINRAPAKVQSALLEAMGERQITIGQTTYDLPPLFMVMATQNPIEHEGTYPLPEAQLDRFLLYVKIDYPDAKTEQAILNLNHQEALANSVHPHTIKPITTAETIFKARLSALQVHLSKALEEYIVQLIMASRQPKAYSEQLAQWIRFGASPRATIGLARAARALAFLNGRDFVIPQDIHAIAHDILRHRILLSYEAIAEGIDSDHIVSQLLTLVAVP